MVHARNAVLKGLSPKENREIPPLRYEHVHRLKKDFPALEIVINGGISSCSSIEKHFMHVDGVMLGRAAYHDPWLIADPGGTRKDVVAKMRQYCEKTVSARTPLRHVARHMLGLYHGHRHARLWRRMLSDPARLSHNDPALLPDAAEAVESTSSKEALDERRTQVPQAEARP